MGFAGDEYYGCQIILVEIKFFFYSKSLILLCRIIYFLLFEIFSSPCYSNVTLKRFWHQSLNQINHLLFLIVFAITTMDRWRFGGLLVSYSTRHEDQTCLRNHKS